jgi:hypothetical protein
LSLTGRLSSLAAGGRSTMARHDSPAMAWPESSWLRRSPCRSSRSAGPDRGDHSLASAEDRPAFQEADHLLDSALARSMAAAVQRSDRQADHTSAGWEDRIRGERLDRGAVSLDFPGSRTWAPCFFPLDCAAGAETGRFSRTDPLRTSFYNSGVFVYCVSGFVRCVLHSRLSIAGRLLNVAL